MLFTADDSPQSRNEAISDIFDATPSLMSDRKENQSAITKRIER